MNILIPFEQVLEFKTKISEISKMSLEHDYYNNEGVVLGNFYISGEYKAHALSVNKSEFNFTIPFSVDYTESINPDTLEFNIEDFSYEIVDDKEVKINIEYSIKADVLEAVNDRLDCFEKYDELELTSELEFIDNFLDEKPTEENDVNKIEETTEIEEVTLIEEPTIKEVKEESKTLVEKELDSENIITSVNIVTTEEKNKKKVQNIEVLEKKEEVEEVRLNKEEEKTIMDAIKDSTDTFVTYHIHIVKENENIESIAKTYKVDVALIKEYNDIDNIVCTDKLLIPKLDE